MLQTGAILCHDKMVSKGIDPGYASKLIQYGWETITEALKHGGITGMMDRLDNPSKIKCFELAAELKEIMQPLYAKHQDDIITGHFSKTMMEDWDNDDVNLLKWRAETVRPPPCHPLSPSPPNLFNPNPNPNPSLTLPRRRRASRRRRRARCTSRSRSTSTTRS